MTQPRITVMQVFAAMGIVPSCAVAWSVGAQMAAIYAEEFGEQPPKDNRPKTSGSGSHCFALYPPTWAGRIEEVIRASVAAERMQLDLFATDEDEGAT